MKEEKKKPLGYEVSYIKLTYDKDGKVATITVKVSRKATHKR